MSNLITNIETQRDEAEAVVNPEAEQLPSFLDLDDRPPSYYRNVTLRESKPTKPSLHHPRPGRFRKPEVRGALAHFEEVFNHPRIQNMPVTTIRDVEKAMRFYGKAGPPPPFVLRKGKAAYNSYAPPKDFDARPPSREVSGVRGEASSSGKVSRSNVPEVTMPVFYPVVKWDRRSPSPIRRRNPGPFLSLPDVLNHRRDELPPPLFRLCRELILEDEAAAEWWDEFEYEPAPDTESDSISEPESEDVEEEEEEVEFPYRLPQVEWDGGSDADSELDGVNNREEEEESEVDPNDERITAGFLMEFQLEPYLADEELSDSESDFGSYMTPPPYRHADPMFPFAEPVTPEMLALGIQTVRLVPKSTTSIADDPPLPFQGKDSEILHRIGSVSVGNGA